MYILDGYALALKIKTFDNITNTLSFFSFSHLLCENHLPCKPTHHVEIVPS